MFTIHHLGKSQSERIIWLCEELEIPYELKRYTRDGVTMLAPANYKALHPMGTAPAITDGDVVLAESGAVVEYIIAKYGRGRLKLSADHPDFAQFLYWFHFANGTLQANMGRLMILNRLKLADDNQILLSTRARVDRAFDLLDARWANASTSRAKSERTHGVIKHLRLEQLVFRLHSWDPSTERNGKRRRESGRDFYPTPVDICCRISLG